MQTIPTGLKKTTSKNGTMHLKNMSAFPIQFPPGELVTINDDGSFTVIATVRYEDASKEATQTYIVDHALTQYYDFEKNEFHATVPVTVHPGIPVDVTLMTFTENDLNPLAAIDSATMMPLVRSGATVELTGVKFQVGPKIYTKSRTYNNVMKSETVFKDEFSLVVSKVATAPSAHHYCVDTLDIIKSTVNPDALVLYDIRDVLSRKARIPDTCWFYIPSDSMYRSPSGALTRLTGTRGPLAKANV
jgi:hypothetical protein